MQPVKRNKFHILLLRKRFSHVHKSQFFVGRSMQRAFDFCRRTDKSRNFAQRNPSPLRNMSPTTIIGIKSFQILRSHRCCQYDRTVLESIKRTFVGQLYQVDLHGQTQRHPVALLPLPLQRQVFTRHRTKLQQFVVDKHPYFFGFHHPGRNPQFQCQLLVFRIIKHKIDCSVVRKTRMLRKNDPFLLPRHTRRNKKIHIQGIFVVCINQLAIFGMVLQPRSHTAPKTRFRLRIHPIMSRPHGREIHKTAPFGLFRRKDMVKQRLLVIIHQIHFRRTRIQHAGQPQHVVGIARFGTLHLFDHRTEIVRRIEMLPHTVSSDTHRAVFRHRFPEETGCTVPIGIVFVIGNTFKPDHFGNLRIGMHSRQAVLFLHQRPQNFQVRKTACQLQIFFFSGNFVHGRKHLVQSAMLAFQHLLHLFVAQSRGNVYHPIGIFHQHIPCLFTPDMNICIQQTVVSLMDIV